MSPAKAELAEVGAAASLLTFSSLAGVDWAVEDGREGLKADTLLTPSDGEADPRIEMELLLVLGIVAEKEDKVEAAGVAVDPKDGKAGAVEDEVEVGANPENAKLVCWAGFERELRMEPVPVVAREGAGAAGEPKLKPWLDLLEITEAAGTALLAAGAEGATLATPALDDRGKAGGWLGMPVEEDP